MPLDWTTQADFDDETDNTGVVHDADGEHPGAATLGPGYIYGGPTDDLIDNGLVEWLPLHEQAGQANDLSGGGGHGTVNGATQGVSGRGGLTAYSFDGTDDYVNVSGLNLDGFTEYSISAWVKLSVKGGDRTIWSADEDAGAGITSLIYEDTNDAFMLRVGTGSSNINIPGTTNPSIGSWYHVVGVAREGGTSEIYVNGTSEGSASTPSFGNPSTSQAIGRKEFDNSNYFGGVIAEVRIYNRALSTSEIQTLHDWGSGDYATPPADGVSYYPFTSANANDAWGSNDGTVNGATHVASGGPRGEGAYSFDGTDDSIALFNPSGMGFTNITIAFWANLDTASTQTAFVHGYDGTNQWMFRNDGLNGEIEWYTFDGSVYGIRTTHSFPTGVWNHYAGTYDGSEYRIFINGVERYSASSASFVVPNTTIDLGYNDAGSDYLAGDMTGVRFYDYALEPWQVQEVYRYGTLGRDMRHFTAQAVA